MKGKGIAIVAMITVAIISGICMLFFGISGMNELNKKTENYVETKGYFSDYNIYISKDQDYSYRLIYSYTVDGVQYSAMTEYATNMLPQKDSAKTVKYNPDNPSEAVVSGESSNFYLIFIGSLFIGVPLIFIIAMLSAIGHLQNFFSNVLDFGMGFILIGVGLGSFYMMTGELSFSSAFQLLGTTSTIPLLIVFLLTAAGFFQLYKCIAVRIKELKDKKMKQ